MKNNTIITIKNRKQLKAQVTRFLLITNRDKKRFANGHFVTAHMRESVAPVACGVPVKTNGTLAEPATMDRAVYRGTAVTVLLDRTERLPEIAKRTRTLRSDSSVTITSESFMAGH